MKLALVVVLALLMVGSVYAEVERPTGKVALMYDLDDGRGEEGIGGALKTDLFGIEGLDTDMFLVSEVGETITTDEKKVVNGVSYNYEVVKGWDAFAGAGVSHLEYQDGELDEQVDKYVYLGVGHLF